MSRHAQRRVGERSKFYGLSQRHKVPDAFLSHSASSWFVGPTAHADTVVNFCGPAARAWGCGRSPPTDGGRDAAVQPAPRPTTDKTET
jgi:hypothetical protein